MNNNDVLRLARDGRVTLPNSLRQKAGLSTGDLLRAEVTENGSIILTPVVAVDRAQAYFWNPRWQQGEREADEDIRAGQVETFERIDDFIHGLNSED
jgi:antitoxin PrlF